jgi:hypothetical protein
MDLRFWTVISSVGFGVNGSVSQDGASFSGTAVDPLPGYAPYASLEQCRYAVTGHRRADQALPIMLDGQWRGTIAGLTTLNLTLSQSGASVSGTGTLDSTVTMISFDVTGTFNRPALDLTLTANGYQPFTFKGTATRTNERCRATTRDYPCVVTRLTGSLDGPGYSIDSLTLMQP